MYFAPQVKGLPLEFGIDASSQKTRLMMLPDGRKSFKIGLAIQTQYRRVIDTQPATQPRCRCKDCTMLCVTQVKIA